MHGFLNLAAERFVASEYGVGHPLGVQPHNVTDTATGPKRVRGRLPLQEGRELATKSGTWTRLAYVNLFMVSSVVTEVLRLSGQALSGQKHARVA